MTNLTDRTDGLELLENDFQLAQLLCSQLNVAIRNANLYKLGFTDSLTHLYASNYFRIRMAQEIARFRRVKSHLSLVMVDVDGLSQISETFDTTTADSALSRVANIIKQVLRFNDIPCRFTKERISIILPDTDVKGGARVSEKIRSAVDSQKILANGKEIKVTISLGVGEFHVQMSLDQLIELSELHLKEARESGGNKVVGG